MQVFFLHAWDFGLSKSNLFVTQFVLLSFPPQGYLADQYLLHWVSSNLQKSHIHCIQLSCGPLPKLISNSTRSWRLGFERAWGTFHWSRMDLMSSSCCKQTDKHMLVTQYCLGDIKVLPSWKKKKKSRIWYLTPMIQSAQGFPWLLTLEIEILNCSLACFLWGTQNFLNQDRHWAAARITGEF